MGVTCSNPNNGQSADHLDLSTLKLSASNTLEKQLTHDKLRLMQSNLRSGIQLEVTVFTKTPIKKG